MSTGAPRLDELRAHKTRLQQWLVETPVVRCRALESCLGNGVELHAKLELFQRTGTFKPRGALATVLQLDPSQIGAGITAVSAGNHAIAAAFAAAAVGAKAKVVMMKSASPIRVQRCIELGAEVVMAEDAHEAFERVEEIRREEGRYYVHPFEGHNVALGTGTVGLEICEQVGEFDAIVIPVGGGGLCAGVSSAVKQLNPECEVIGVEPAGAAAMHRSFASGKPETLAEVNTIADSLGAPFAMDYSFRLCQQNVDRLVMVEDRQICDAMGVLFRHMRLAVEPACAASTAAIAGPLRQHLRGKKVVLLFCGSNIDWPTFARDANLEVPDAV